MSSTSFNLKAKDGSTLEATTDHAWDEPRGEVYIEIADPSMDESGDYALTPDEARNLAKALLELADHADTFPEATHDEEGNLLND